MKQPVAFVIEDDPEVSELYCHALGLVGFSPELIDTREKVLVRLEEVVPDLILLDLRLGNEFAGPDLLKRIRANRQWKDIPVIVISGYPRIAENLFDQADFVLLKPFDLRQLMGLTQRLQYKDEAVRKPITSNMLDPHMFMKRLSFNWRHAQQHAGHIFPVMLFSIALADEKIQSSNREKSLSKLDRDIANRIKQRTRAADICACLDKNQYSVMLYGIAEPSNAVTVAARLVEALECPFHIDGDIMSVHVNVGIAISNGDSADADELLSQARNALDKAIRGKKKIVVSA